MTPKEKAEELVDKMKWEGEDAGEQAYQDFAKECALIAVEEIIETLNKEVYPRFQYDDTFEYWKQVKQEIQAL